MAGSDEEREDVDRWRLFRARAVGNRVPPCPEAGLLAAYAESRTSALETEAIESHLALCSSCLDQLAEARALAREPTGAVAQTVLQRAKSLVPPSVVLSSRHLGLPPPAPVLRARQALNWVAVAAAVLAVGYAGFSMGAVTAVGRAEATSVPSLAGSFDIEGSVSAPVPGPGPSLLPAGGIR